MLSGSDAPLNETYPCCGKAMCQKIQELSVYLGQSLRKDLLLVPVRIAGQFPGISSSKRLVQREQDPA